MKDDVPEGDYRWTDNDQIDIKLIDKTSKLKLIEKSSIDNDTNIEISSRDKSIQGLEESIQKLEQTISQFAYYLKTYTDAKSWQAIPKKYIAIRKYANYYDVYNIIKTVGPTDPNDFDSPIYNTERIFEVLERYADVIHVINNGTDTLYVVVSHGGRTNFSQEAPIFPGEVKEYYNVYELRLRSPTEGLPYRVTEYYITNISEIPLIPIEKANLHDQPLPAADTDWLATDISPTRTPTTFKIEVTVSIAGTLSAAITKDGNTQIVTFNVVPGPVLVPGGIYVFDLLVHSGDTINFRYSTTGGTIQILRVQEIDASTA